ncbi:hypothetical protein FOL47_001352 [Perkinsus chesapeaki]|uniref:Uncharacterized protein n=1 Tax=Perkinsus chesapeaki TaxID=330153 RepID=A0A7J6MJF8_PERCH|nr:hypothetical protein FOL47_001352 [Perkinsus chesapeaki]
MAWSDSTSNPGSPAMSDEPELDRGPSGGVSSQGKTKHAVFQDGYRITLLPTSECDIFRDQGFSWSYHVAGGNRRSQKATEVTYDGVIAPQAAVKHIRDPLAESKIPAKNPENSGDCLDAANAVKNFLMSGKGQGGFYDFFETLCSFYKMNVFDKIEESDKVDISELKIRV